MFTNPQIQTHVAVHCPALGIELNCEAVTVYTDGACFANGTDDARVGAEIWFGPDHAKNEVSRVPGPVQSNQIGELFAVILAEEAVPPFTLLHIKSDSKYAIDALMTNLEKYQAKGWIGIANTGLIKYAAHQLQC